LLQEKNRGSGENKYFLRELRQLARIVERGNEQDMQNSENRPLYDPFTVRVILNPATALLGAARNAALHRGRS
jgi:hypothetical protein